MQKTSFLPLKVLIHYYSSTTLILILELFYESTIKFRLSYLSHGQCRTDIMGIQLFLKFINLRYPTWNTLNQLMRKDIEDYLCWYNSYTEGYNVSKKGYLIALHRFIENIQRFEYTEAPEKPASMLIYKEDWPRYVKTTENSIKYIPESVLTQLEDNLEYVSAIEYLQIILLLRASGWRISDILNLRYDTCLERTAQGWYLCGDILKTQVLNHRVPITDEIANFLYAIVEDIKTKSSIDNNPNKFLFVKLNGKRKGHPFHAIKISQCLNRLAQQRNILMIRAIFFILKIMHSAILRLSNS